MASLNLFTDKDVENLTKIKELLQEIKELNIGFDYSNIIEVDNNTTLIFTTNTLYKEMDLQRYEEILTNKLECNCVILRNGFELDKATKKENKKIDYETETFYADGEVVREVTTQYK